MAEQPSLGGAIALQGRNTIAEQLGKMQFQVAQKEADRAAKRGIEEAKRIAEIEKKFAIPKGQYHRLVVPEIGKTQAKYLEQVKTLKAERPNNWQNEIENIANSYIGEMERLETLSRDLTDYDTKTSSVDKANTYFSNEWKKYNFAYENAKDLTDFENRLAASGFNASKASDFVVRPNRSISYTPFANQKPLETIVAQVQKVPTIEYKEVDRPGAFGSITTKKVQKRPATIEEAKEILRTNKDLFQDINEIQTIEDVVDSYMSTNPYGVRQYSDQNNLNLRQNPDGTTNMEDLVGVKQHIMDRVGKMTSPKVSERVAFAPRQNVFNIGTTKEEGGLAVGGSWAPGEYRATEYGKPSYVAWDYNYNFDKEPQILNLKAENTFDSEFNPITPGNKEVQATGLVILLTDRNGNPVDASQASNATQVTNTGVFVRLKAGSDYVFQKVDNYNNLSSQFLKKPSEQLNKDFIDANIKRAAMLKNIKELRAKEIYDFEKFATLPKQK